MPARPRRRLRTLLSVLLAVVLAASVLPVRNVAVAADGARPSFASGGPPLRRGVGVHNALNWADADAKGTGFTWPPFARPDHDLPKGSIVAVKHAGFDFVRLTVDPGPFLFFTGARRDELDTILMSIVQRFLDERLDVLVDFHPNDQVAAFSPVRLVDDETSPLFVRYLSMLRRTAALLGKLDPGHVAIEPMNEPATGWHMLDRRRWGRMQERMHAAVRAAAPDLLVMLTGAKGGGDAGLIELDPAPFSGSRVRFSFHYYLPYAFTHQGVGDAGEGRIWRYLGGIPYPAGRSQLDMFWPVFEARVEADADLDADARRQMLAAGRDALGAYFERGADHARIAEAFDGVANWARSHGIDPRDIFLGEFGTTREGSDVAGARSVHRADWLHQIVSEAETRGFGWSIWTLIGDGGMAIVEGPDAAALDGSTLQAIGLHP